MSDNEIRLFGKTIPLALAPLKGHEVPTNDEPPCRASASVVDSEIATAASGGEEEDCSNNKPPLSCSDTTSPEKQENKETMSGQELTADKQEDNPPDQSTEDLKRPTTSSGISENPETPSADREPSVSLKSSKNGEQSDETSSSQDKTLKKPDKILPCPRCNSMDTKFCYYNNYNVNQPRHFCKNCQRYWTAGGIMRNVPVGAGRRKNKNASSASHYRHMLMSDALQTARASAAASNGGHTPTLGRNGRVLTFGSDSPLCESMASVLSLAEKTQNCVQNGVPVPDQQRILVPSVAGDNGDDQSCGSSNVTASNSSERGGKAGLQEPAVHNSQGFPPHQVPCFPGAPWQYQWNSPQWTSAMPPPAFFHSGFPISFYPAPPYWGCTAPGSWNVPCNSPPSSTLSYCGTSSGPNSPTLGKHSRDGDILNQASSHKEEPSRENRSDRCVLIPKTLRIDDPSEAAKSSIWETLGIKNEKGNFINEGGIFKSFQSKGDEKRQVVETSSVLQANPAAFSRSLNFRERT